MKILFSSITILTITFLVMMMTIKMFFKKISREKIHHLNVDLHIYHKHENHFQSDFSY